jgi:subtilisin family serine protease
MREDLPMSDPVLPRRSHPARRWLCVAALLASGVGVGAPPDEVAREVAAAEAPAMAFRMRHGDGATIAEGRVDRERPVVIHGGMPGRTPTTALALRDPDRPSRMLIRLHGEALVPFLQRRRAGVTTAAEHAALAQQVAEHADTLQRTQQELADALRAQGHAVAVHRRFTHLVNVLGISAREADLAALRRDPRVASVHPDIEVRADLAQSVPLINAPALWATTDPLGAAVTGHGITVAVLDTGIDYRHPDLGACFGIGCKVAGGHDFVNDDADPLDDHGHGTHVAGIVAADGLVRGVAPDATLLAYKVLDAGGWGLASDIIAGLERAIDPDQDPLSDDGADVINLSLGGDGAADHPMSEAANAAVAAGAVVIVAAGNSGSAYQSIGTPGNAARAITVAASTNFDTIAYFSSRGPIPQQEYVKPDLTAPGFFIESTTLDGGHVRLSGTSMAAPHVAGGAALLRQREPGATPDAIRARLAAGAVPLDADPWTQGAGRLDLLAASQTPLLLDPPLLSFGRIDTSQTQWQRTRTVRVSNVDQVMHTLTLSAGDSLPAGAQLSVEPAGFSLAPGASREIELTLSIDNSVLPYPDSESLHFDGVLSSSAGPALRLPFVFAKHESLTLTVDSDSGWGHALFLRRSDGDSFERVVVGSEAEPTHEFALRPGTYHAIATLWTGATMAWILRDDILVQGPVVDTLAQDEAVNRIHVAQLIDPEGRNLTPDAIAEGVIFEAIDPQSLYGLTSFALTSGTELFLSNALPSRYLLRATTSFTAARSTDQAQRRYLVSDFRVPGSGGLNADWPLALDARTAGKVEFEYADPHRLQQSPLGVQNWTWLFRALPGYPLVTISTYPLMAPRTFDAPIRATVYGSASDLALDGLYTEFVTSELLPLDPFNHTWTPVALSGILGFVDAGRYARIRRMDRFTGQVTIDGTARDTRLSIDDGGLFFASRFISEGFRLRATNDRIETDWDLSLVQRDADQNEFRARYPYQLRCDGGTITRDGELGAAPDVFVPMRWVMQAIEVPFDCFDSPLELTLAMSVDVLDQQTPSEVALRLAVDSDPSDAVLWRAAPHLAELRLLDDGLPSRLLDGEAPSLQLRWEGAPAPQVTVELRLEGDADWQPLPLSFDAGLATAALPRLAQRHLASLRIVSLGADGSREQQTLNDLFLLGGNTVFADGFE